MLLVILDIFDSRRYIISAMHEAIDHESHLLAVMSDFRVLPTDEDPILQCDNSRYVLFPIRYPEVRGRNIRLCNDRLVLHRSGTRTRTLMGRFGPRLTWTSLWIVVTGSRSSQTTSASFCRWFWDFLQRQTA